MSDRGNQYRRWAELMDRRAIGEPLSPEELEFCEAFVAENPVAQREMALMDELADMDVSAQTSDTRALVDGALARLAAEVEGAEARAEQETLDAIRRTDRSPRLLWASGIAAAAAAAAATWVIVQPQPQAVKPVEVAGTVVEAPAPAPRIELVFASGDVRVDGEASTETAMLPEGAVLEVGAQGAACLAMDPEIDLCLPAGSRLVLTRTDSPQRRLDLTAGKVAVQLAPQPEGMKLSIVADGVWSTAIGTAFTVSARGNGDDEGVRTTVLSGKVRVGADGGRNQIVSAHQRARVTADSAVVSAISRTDESPEWALLRPAALWDSPVSATLRVTGLPVGAEVLLGEERIGVSPLSTLVPVGSHELHVRLEGVTVLTRAVQARAGQTSVFDFTGETLGAAPGQAPPAAKGAEKKERPPAAAKSAAEMLTQARGLMQQSRFEEAAKHYVALRNAHPGSREARTVLVPLAQLQLRLGRADAALASLDRYLSGGRGALAEEARHTRIRALRSLGRGGDETDAIREFLELHPKSFQAGALSRRLERLND
ncbi:MAG: PEGA domain-containing protein [Myxococcales bacterium]|nr:PEGA domain-containing protein [Myxococcales bacterium]